MNIIQELGLVEEVLADVGAFAAGQPVGTNVKVGSQEAKVSVIHLPSGPNSQYVAISGSFFSILGLVLGDAAAISEGAPVSVAIKESNSWYGLTVQLQIAAPAPAA